MAWLMAQSFGRVALAVVVAVSLVAAALGIGTYLRDTVAQWAWLPTWLSAVASWLGSPPPAEMNHQAIVAAALAVMGTLAAVYFATVAFVVSTTYKDATSRIRGLVTRLPGGRIYTTVYVQAVLFGLITLMLPMTGREPNRLLLSVVTVLGGFVVLSFGRLRTQLYGLLEPAGLLPVVQRDIGRLSRQASRLVGRDPTGLRTRLIRARTLESLFALRDLCYLIRDRERTASNVPAEYAGTDPRVVSAAQHILAVWLQYARRKQVLIRLPDWCFQRRQHKDWLLASESEVGIALATATTLEAAATDDVLWVERHLAEILSELIGGRELPQLSSILGDLRDPVRELLSRGMFAESRLWMQAVVSPARAVTTHATPQPTANSAPSEAPAQEETGAMAVSTPDTENHLYNLVDFVALAYIQAVLGLHDYAQALSADFPHWVAAMARGKDARSLGPVPSELLGKIHDALRFEEAVEGHRVTSDANIKQLVARAVGTETIDEATALMSTFEDDFWPWTSHLIAGNTPSAGAALSRLDEALHKWEISLSALSKLFEQCEVVHRDVDDVWPDLSVDGLSAKRTALQDRLRTPIARIASRVVVDMDPSRPDVFGWAFYRAHQDLLDDVLSDQTPNETDIEERLRGLVVATDRATRRLRTTVRRQHNRVLGSLWSEPMLMLLQLSGIALVTALMKQRSDQFNVFEHVWRGLLDANAKQVLDATLAALALDDPFLGLTSGNLKRSHRHQQAMAAIEGLGVSSELLDFQDLEESHPQLSAKLTAMLHHVAFHDFAEVFVAGWIVPEARQRGAVLSDYGLGDRFMHLIENLTVPDETGPRKAD